MSSDFSFWTYLLLGICWGIEYFVLVAMCFVVGAAFLFWLCLAMFVPVAWFFPPPEVRVLLLKRQHPGPGEIEALEAI